MITFRDDTTEVLLAKKQGVIKVAGPVRSGQDQLVGAVKRIEMLIVKVLLAPRAAVGSRPELDGICGELYVYYSHGERHHNHEAHQEHLQRMASHYGSPYLEE